jgi:hypothetical protein
VKTRELFQLKGKRGRKQEGNSNRIDNEWKRNIGERREMIIHQILLVMRVTTELQKISPWPESTIEQYRLSDHHLLTKLVPTFED